MCAVRQRAVEALHVELELRIEPSQYSHFQTSVNAQRVFGLSSTRSLSHKAASE